MHFRTSITGLATPNIEACVKGEFIENGVTRTFFGCDSIRIVP